LSKTLGQVAELDVTDELKKSGLEALYHWHDGAADHDVTLMVYKVAVSAPQRGLTLPQSSPGTASTAPLFSLGQAPLVVW
jgi:hypothetical protein